MSIVSVYCKSLLRLFIVGVYCKYLLCFVVFSVQNVARSLVLLRFRLQKLIFESVLLCFCSHMCKKHYKTSQKSCFFAYRLAKPFVLPLQIVALPKTIHFFDFYEETRVKMKQPLRPRSRRPAWPGYAYIVVSVYSPL